MSVTLKHAHLSKSAFDPGVSCLKGNLTQAGNFAPINLTEMCSPKSFKPVFNFGFYVNGH